MPNGTVVQEMTMKLTSVPSIAPEDVVMYGCEAFEWFRELVAESQRTLYPVSVSTKGLANDTLLAKGKLVWSEVQAELAELSETISNAKAAEVATKNVKVDHAAKINKNTQSALSSPDFQKFTSFVHCQIENATAQALEVSKKFVRDVMCDQNLATKDVAVVVLVDHSLCGAYSSSHVKLTRDFVLGFGPYPVFYFYPEKPRSTNKNTGTNISSVVESKSPVAPEQSQARAGDGADSEEEDEEDSEPGDVLPVELTGRPRKSVAQKQNCMSSSRGTIWPLTKEWLWQLQTVGLL